MIPKRFCSSNETADLTLQQEYDGWFPRILSLRSLTEDKGMQQMVMLLQNRVAQSERPLDAICLYADLQNPLLQKYKFDALDFVVGAKYAYIKVISAISSVNFSNYSNGYAAKSEDHAVLCAVLHPSLYGACIEAARSLHKAGISTTMTGNDVSSVTMTRVATTVVTAESLRRREELKKEKEAEAVAEADSSMSSVDATASGEPSSSTLSTNSGSSDELKATTAGPITGSSPDTVKMEALKDKTLDDSAIKMTVGANADASTEDLTSATATSNSSSSASSTTGSAGVTREEEGEDGADMGPVEEDYPVGAVLATVDVLCEATEKYQTRFTDGEDVQSERQSAATWTFRGCISGHVELDWKVVAFDGLGNKHF